jgi:hypothetical protein
MLAQIRHWFTKGFDIADLEDAETLLEELSLSAPIGKKICPCWKWGAMLGTAHGSGANVIAPYVAQRKEALCHLTKWSSSLSLG